MTYMSIPFAIFVVFLLLIYYIFPINKRWIVLLAGSLGFYYVIDKKAILFVAITAIFSFLCGFYIEKLQEIWKKKTVFYLAVLGLAGSLLLIKEGSYIYTQWRGIPLNLIIPIGISFYTLQIVSYLSDVYQGKITAEKNVFRYMLFVLYFPQIVQGPIPRYKTLSVQLFRGNKFDENLFSKGFISILWGWFLKLMIADKAAVIVDTIFGSPEIYKGTYVLIGGVLYSIQLYTDFQSCVCIARGVSELFGIKLDKNFNHPYFSRNIADFWRRWHMTLSSWFRDYIYIPLGGNRKGILRKYLNLVIVFIVSGIWHGEGFKFIFWGLMHGIYQVVGGITKPFRQEMWAKLGVKEDNKVLIVWQQMFTFICVMFAWIIFRASSLKAGLIMIESVFTVYNPWILLNDSLYTLGLSWKEIVVLVLSILTLFKISSLEEEESVRDKILNYHILIRWTIYIACIVVVMVFGTYGYGFDAKDFIYGGF